MTECNFCKGTGKMPIYTSMQSLRGPSIFSHNEPCPACDATGVEKDPVIREHEEGDADGMGGCRAVLVAFALTGAVGVTAWALTTWLGPLIFHGS
jgi:hypothetical protein